MMAASISSQWVRSLRAVLRNRTAFAGAVITLIVLFGVSIGAELMPYSAVDMDFVNILAPPTLAHPLGTDSLGRDVLTRALFGGRVSLLISFSGVLLAAVAGTLAGMTSAYHGGLTDAGLMRVSDLLFAFPSFVLALFLMVVLGFGVQNVALAIALVYFPIFARLARNMTLLVKGEPYVQAARLMGQSTLRILFREILPNIAAPLVVQASVGVAFGIVIEAGLSFLGLGVQPPIPSLGVIMADGREYFQRGPWVLTLTGLVVSIALLGLNLLGDGLRDLTDPKLRRRTES
jgi:peptide/nickel transport system permease protein